MTSVTCHGIEREIVDMAAADDGARAETGCNVQKKTGCTQARLDKANEACRALGTSCEKGWAVLMHPGVPLAPRPAQPCRHGQAVLTPPSRGSRGLGTTRAREHGMALQFSAGVR